MLGSAVSFFSSSFGCSGFLFSHANGQKTFGAASFFSYSSFCRLEVTLLVVNWYAWQLCRLLGGLG
jgi:hypothetical protein